MRLSGLILSLLFLALPVKSMAAEYHIIKGKLVPWRGGKDNIDFQSGPVDFVEFYGNGKCNTYSIGNMLGPTEHSLQKGISPEKFYQEEYDEPFFAVEKYGSRQSDYDMKLFKKSFVPLADELLDSLTSFQQDDNFDDIMLYTVTIIREDKDGIRAFEYAINTGHVVSSSVMTEEQKRKIRRLDKIIENLYIGGTGPEARKKMLEPTDGYAYASDLISKLINKYEDAYVIHNVFYRPMIVYCIVNKYKDRNVPDMFLNPNIYKNCPVLTTLNAQHLEDVFFLQINMGLYPGIIFQKMTNRNNDSQTRQDYIRAVKLMYFHGDIEQRKNLWRTFDVFKDSLREAGAYQSLFNFMFAINANRENCKFDSRPPDCPSSEY